MLIWLVAGVTDLRKGLDSLAALVQNQLLGNPFSGDVYIFRGRRGDKVKLLWYSGDGVCLPRAHILHPWPGHRFDARTHSKSPVR